MPRALAPRGSLRDRSPRRPSGELAPLAGRESMGSSIRVRLGRRVTTSLALKSAGGAAPVTRK
jgi:hypothetical protein